MTSIRDEMSYSSMKIYSANYEAFLMSCKISSQFSHPDCTCMCTCSWSLQTYSLLNYVYSASII